MFIMHVCKRRLIPRRWIVLCPAHQVSNLMQKDLQEPLPDDKRAAAQIFSVEIIESSVMDGPSVGRVTQRTARLSVVQDDGGVEFNRRHSADSRCSPQDGLNVLLRMSDHSTTRRKLPR